MLEELEQDPVCAAQLAAARTCQDPCMAEEFREGALSPPRVEACVAGATSLTPESEFGEGDSEEEQEENYPSSVGEASTVDYSGEVDPAPSVYSVPTVDYGEGDEEEEDYPPSVGSSRPRRLDTGTCRHLGDGLACRWMC
ncbi:uncharacterized protein LOC143521138 [Brachyhypopomus gauderio]|uniref:uncharacterized protein LOC143521138 n=1 Tax=Brachyhypopomus gauderio TaxID=698409 RepID=UPI0040435A85